MGDSAVSRRRVSRLLPLPPAGRRVAAFARMRGELFERGLLLGRAIPLTVRSASALIRANAATSPLPLAAARGVRAPSRDTGQLERVPAHLVVSLSSPARAVQQQ